MSDQCPNRGPGLSHAHALECATDHGGIHAPAQCCHCGSVQGEVLPPPPPPSKVEQGFDIYEESRLFLPPPLEQRYRPRPVPHERVRKNLAFLVWRLMRMQDGGS